MYIIKRDGSQVNFDKNKIINAINGANKEVSMNDRLTDDQINKIADEIEISAQNSKYAFNVEEIQNKVEDSINELKKFNLGRAYSTYRFKQAEKRKKSILNEKIKAIVDFKSEEAKQENSNKNPHVAPTQRDYMAGEISKEITMDELLPPDIVSAHNEGIIHFHDSDYFLNHIYNCSLIDLKDMFENGTVISETKIDTPKSFSTACNIMTQIMAQVASSQYGGQSMTLSHIAPFVDVSRQKIKNSLLEDFGISDVNELSDEMKELFDRQLSHRLHNEVVSGVQTIQYQILTLLTTNGQTPFVTLFMYLDEVEEGPLRDDLSLIIKEVLIQRMQGVKNEKGDWITPAFPKLIYVLDEDNAYEGSKYFDLTKLAAKCTAKRMVPDYISAKKMREFKDGNVYPCMGCVEGNEVITYKINDKLYVESFERMWDRISLFEKVKTQKSSKYDKYIDLYDSYIDVKIYDKINGFVKVKRLIRNLSTNWVKVKMSNGRLLTCTDDHPFYIENKGRVFAKDLVNGDIVLLNKDQYSDDNTVMDCELAYSLGVFLCDGCYDNSAPTVSLALENEDEIIEAIQKPILDYFGNKNSYVSIKEQRREKKGNYKDVSFHHINPKMKSIMINIYGGITKSSRHIPNFVFSLNKEGRYSFLAGMIDADGYINNSGSLVKLQIGSTNKELAIQQMLLLQSLGYNTSIYENYYSKNNKTKIRYRVECNVDDTLISYLKCVKKINHFKTTVQNNKSISLLDRGSIVSVENIDMVDYSYDVTTESDHFDVSGIYSHNCRSFLTSEKEITNSDGTQKFYGRFNQGVVTINLPDVALSSNGDFDKFWKIYDERLELCHRALRKRHERLLGTPSDIAPILWQYGAIARLEKGEKIDKLLYNGYSTISLGYAGLYECVKYMTGKSHTDPEATHFAMQVMQKLNDKCNEWREAENIAYSVYGTPIESTTYKFAKCLQKRFGIIEGITDHNYITNSYHCCVRENINAFEKLAFEAPFQKLSPGGAISYVETPDLNDNIEAVVQVMQFIYENIIYAELNTKSDYCQVCGSTSEIKIIEEEKTGKLIWECPCCGNRDQDKMNVARRTCGYIGTQFWNQGRTQEIRERVIHLDNMEYIDENE